MWPCPPCPPGGRPPRYKFNAYDRVPDGCPRIVDENTQRLIEQRLAGKADAKIKQAAASALGKVRGTCGIFTGALFDEGERCKVKGCRSTDVNVQRHTDRYVKAVRVLDDILICGQDQIVAAHMTVDHDNAELVEAVEAAEYALL